MKWMECNECETEFRVVSDSLETVAYCPFCSEPIEEDIQEEYDFDE